MAYFRTVLAAVLLLPGQSVLWAESGDIAVTPPKPGAALVEQLPDSTFSLVYLDIGINSQSLSCRTGLFLFNLICSLRYEQLVHPNLSVLGHLSLPSQGPRLGAGAAWYPFVPWTVGLAGSALFHFPGSNPDADWRSSGSVRAALVTNLDIGSFTRLKGFRLSLHVGYSRNLTARAYNFAFTDDDLDLKSGTGFFLELSVGLAF